MSDDTTRLERLREYWVQANWHHDGKPGANGYGRPIRAANQSAAIDLFLRDLDLDPLLRWPEVRDVAKITCTAIGYSVVDRAETVTGRRLERLRAALMSDEYRCMECKETINPDLFQEERQAACSQSWCLLSVKDYELGVLRGQISERHRLRALLEETG